MSIKRLRIIAQGQVQGVGFRPFIWKVAHKNELTGFCRNTGDGVEIEVQGNSENINKFALEMAENPPVLSRIEKMDRKWIDCVKEEKEFHISESLGAFSSSILVAPDVSTCPDCFEDIMDETGKRYLYPFANCVNCGPRFSITKTLPYDRPNTVMDCFPMCEDCKNEYQNPSDRRFHAQPIACAKCGPVLWYADKNAETTSLNLSSSENALQKAADELLKGKIVALKGLGGFQLACDARNSDSVARLRNSKARPHKALAVMTRNIESASQFCLLDCARRNLLESSAKPIVLCEKKNNPVSPLSNLIAPDSENIGIMLPYTPLHFLLLEDLYKKSGSEPVLVMTSGNAQDEPICLSNREALDKLDKMADGWLLHNRDILVRVDDSVACFGQNLTKNEKEPVPVLIRRARGMVPLPVESPFLCEKSVFGAGAELKSTFSISRNNQIFTSQHIGDLKSPQTLDFYSSVYQHLNHLLGTKPALIVHDLHPDFISTAFAKELAATYDLPLIPLQHHAAHAAALLCEHKIREAALVVCLDGSGLGTEGSIWGGEFLKVNLGRGEWERVGSFENFVLPGGEQAIREPWRVARAINPEFVPQSLENIHKLKLLDEMIAKNINSPSSSSCGRIFDAMSAMLGLCEKITYEGQAAIRLETAALKWFKKNGVLKVKDRETEEFIVENGLPKLAAGKLVLKIHEYFQIDKNVEKAAFHFHALLCKGLLQLAKKIAEKNNLQYVGFSGGVLQNSLLVPLLQQETANMGLIPLFHKSLPPGDACISLGQAAWGQSIIAKSD